MSGPGDIGGEVSGDEAAWRDLIARFDVPTDRTTTVVPWPASEDLPEPPGSAEPGSQAAPHESPPDRAAGRAEAHSRITDPTGSIADPSGQKRDPTDPTANLSGRVADPSGRTDPVARRPDSPGAPDQTARPATGFVIPVDGTRVIRPADSPRSYTPAEETDEPYVPVPLPPPARLDSTSKAALAGVIGGPGYLLVASVFLHWTISAEAALIAVAAFVGGFVTLVMKFGDRSGRDDDNDGAVL
jgi:hypothetical protein